MVLIHSVVHIGYIKRLILSRVVCPIVAVVLEFLSFWISNLRNDGWVFVGLISAYDRIRFENQSIDIGAVVLWLYLFDHFITSGRVERIQQNPRFIQECQRNWLGIRVVNEIFVRLVAGAVEVGYVGSVTQPT